MWILLACAFREPAQTPPLVAARGPVRVVEGPVRPGTVSVVVRAGSAYDPPGREGLAWIAAHSVAPDAVVDVGPEIVRIDLASAALTTGVLNLSPNEAAVATARAAALSELRGGDCESTALRAWDSWALAGHPYGHAVEGRASVIPTITASEVHAFLRARYTRDATRVAAAGPLDVAPLDSLLPTLSRRVTPAVPPPMTASPRLWVSAPVGTSCVAIGRADDGAVNAAEVATLRALARAIGAEADSTVRAESMVRWALPLGEAASAASVENVWNRVTSQRTISRVPRALGLMQPAPSASRLAAEDLLPGLPRLSLALLPDEAEVGTTLARVLDASRLRMVVIAPDLTRFHSVESPAPMAVQSIEDLLR